jgi:deoxyribodipyrimidine photo-lyase
MKSIFIFRRDLRLEDNTTLIHADNNNEKIIPIFIYDPHQIENKDKSDNCVQFMVESLKDLHSQLRKHGSKLHTFYGKPWEIIEKIIGKEDIGNVYVNKDYTVYSKYRDKKIADVCKKNKNPVNFVSFEDLMLHNIDDIKTETGKIYEKFTPYYSKASKISVGIPKKHSYKNLIKNYTCLIKTFNATDKLYVHNDKIYIHGGRQNGLKILRNIKHFSDYNKVRSEPQYDTTLLSPHNKFGTLSIREVFHTVKNKLGNKNEIIRQLYWRDFYYNQMYFNEDYFHLKNGKYSKIKWKNNPSYFKKWKSGETGIPIVDAGMRQLNETGWIHNRVRLLVSTVLTKILHVDWRLGEKYFKQKLLDYDVTQNIMNWYWVSGESAFASPYFRVMNPDSQTKSHDKECKYIEKWIELEENGKCLSSRAIVDIPKMIKESIKVYASIKK